MRSTSLLVNKCYQNPKNLVAELHALYLIHPSPVISRNKIPCVYIYIYLTSFIIVHPHI